MRAGFIGMGNMGSSIARDLAGSDHELTVYDVNEQILFEFRKLGSYIARNPAEVATRSEVVGVCVRTEQQVMDVLDNLLEGATPGLIVAIHSTINITCFEQIRAKAEAKHVHVVDAPVSRGTNAPPTKAINFMLGGDPKDIDRVAEFVAPAAINIVKAGKSGSAMILKLCNNIIGYLQTVTLRDVFRLAEAAELDLNKLAQLVSANGVAGPNMLFSIAKRAGAKTDVKHLIDTAEVNAILGEKDLEAALEAAASLGVELPAVTLARSEFREAIYDLLS